MSAGPAAAGDLDRALAPGGVRMLFQPIVDLEQHALIGHEALARGPVGSQLESPMALLLAARADDRLAELDWLCRAEAFRCSLAHPRPAPWRVFVNAEPETLHSPCPEHLAAVLARAHRHLDVVVELTERFLLQRPADLIRVVGTLRELGWEIALDDAGANAASVALLPVLAPDIVKLDRPLLAPRLDRQARAALTAITAYVRRSGAVLLAEGIETEADLQRARELGARWGQGYLFGRPQALSGVDVERPAPRSGPDAAGPAAWDLLPDSDALVQLAAGGPRLVVDLPWLHAQLAATVDLAAAAPDNSIVLVSAGAPGAVLPELVDRLHRLQASCAYVGLQLPTVAADVPRSLRATAATGSAAARREIAAVVMTPEACLGISGRLLDDGRVEVALSTDAVTLAAVARLLLSRLPAA
ncbi:MAG: hypothetical protein JWN77_3271 [Frankiales bacterium]|nr:hypothetical protein [Frankiales bacterium]